MKKVSKKQKYKQEKNSWIVPDYQSLNLETKENVIEVFTSMIHRVFERGGGLRNEDLKNFTGSTLEILGESALRLVCISLNIPIQSINQKYLKCEGFDNLRLDDHLYIDDKIYIMQEDRAWVDKPFASLKWSVITDILILPHGNDLIIKDIIFPILCYSYDVTQKTLNTRNYVFNDTLASKNIKVQTSYGEDRIKLFNLSGNKRDSRKDYFNKGYSQDEIRKYIDYIYNHMELYKKGKLII